MLLGQLWRLAGAFILFLLFIFPALLLDEAGYKILGSLLAALGIGLFMLSILFIVFAPIVRAFRSKG